MARQGWRQGKLKATRDSVRLGRYSRQTRAMICEIMTRHTYLPYFKYIISAYLSYRALCKVSARFDYIYDGGIYVRGETGLGVGGY